MKKIIIDKQLLNQYYVIENHCIAECAKYFGVSVSSINRAIKKYNLIKSKRDIYTKRASNNIIKYGNSNPSGFGSNIFKNAIQVKYGVDNPAKSSEVQDTY